MKNKGFSLVELLVVITIIGLLSTITFVSYSSFLKQSRDAKRKADIEQIRSALELYRSNNQSYPVAISFGGTLVDPTGAPTSNTYMTKIPQDPQPSKYTYYYTISGGNYIIGSYLESASTTCSVVYSCIASGGSGSFGAGGVNCNYCVGPYGQQ